MSYNQMVPYKQPSSGADKKHNFMNRYIDQEDLQKPTKEISNAITKATSQQFNQIVGVKTEPAYAATVNVNGKKGPEYIKYTPKQQGNGLNSGASQRMVKMYEVQKDPLEPAKFKHKRVPKGPGSPPPQVLHSPPRKLTAKDQQDWKIPPSISNWKNANGYTIPLEMRVAADGRTMQQHTVNDKFAKMADVFHLLDRQKRKEIEERTKIQESLAYKNYLAEEKRMKDAAAKARLEKNKILQGDDDDDEENDVDQFEGENNSNPKGKGRENENQSVSSKRRNPYVDQDEQEARKQRDTMRQITKREVERDHRQELARNKKSKTLRDAERDISEKVALGQAQPTMSKETMYDQRLFNQTSGLESGFGDDDEYNVFDKPLFQDKAKASIYNLKEYNDDDDDGAQAADDNQGENRKGTKTFEGAEKKGSRNKPVEFEQHDEDMFEYKEKETKIKSDLKTPKMSRIDVLKAKDDDKPLVINIDVKGEIKGESIEKQNNDIDSDSDEEEVNASFSQNEKKELEGGLKTEENMKRIENYIADKKYKEAYEDVKLMLKDNKANPEIYTTMALCQKSMSFYIQSIKSLQEAVNLDPNIHNSITSKKQFNENLEVMKNSNDI